MKQTNKTQKTKTDKQQKLNNPTKRNKQTSKQANKQ